MVMRAGELRHRVRVQETVRTDDGAGGHTLSFRTIDTIAARVFMSAGREVMEAKKLNAKVSHVVRLRARTDITPAHRFMFNGTALNILSIGDPDGKGVEMIAQCEETLQ